MKHMIQRTPWTLVCMWAGIGLILHAHRCYADAICPWVNAATVGSILNGKVERVEVTSIGEQGDASCVFSFGPGSSVGMFQVVIHTMSDSSKEFSSYLSQCSSGVTALRSTGNEAVQCQERELSSGREERVVGRVRDRVFLLSMHRFAETHASPGTKNNDAMKSIAQQIASNLF